MLHAFAAGGVRIVHHAGGLLKIPLVVDPDFGDHQGRVIIPDPTACNLKVHKGDGVFPSALRARW